jgi:hypothetical protein
VFFASSMACKWRARDFACTCLRISSLRCSEMDGSSLCITVSASGKELCVARGGVNQGMAIEEHTRKRCTLALRLASDPSAAPLLTSSTRSVCSRILTIWSTW